MPGSAARRRRGSEPGRITNVRGSSPTPRGCPDAARALVCLPKEVPTTAEGLRSGDAAATQAKGGAQSCSRPPSGWRKGSEKDSLIQTGSAGDRRGAGHFMCVAPLEVAGPRGEKLLREDRDLTTRRSARRRLRAVPPVRAGPADRVTTATRPPRRRSARAWEASRGLAFDYGKPGDQTGPSTCSIRDGTADPGTPDEITEMVDAPTAAPWGCSRADGPRRLPPSTCARRCRT